MKFTFNSYNIADPAKVYLSYSNKNIICKLNALHMKPSLYVNGISSFKFQMYKYNGTQKNLGYDKIDIGLYFYVNNAGWFRITNIERIDDGKNPLVEITGYDLSTELTQTLLTSIGSLGTEDDEQGGLDRYSLYDASDPSHSIAHMFMIKNPGWVFTYIDDAISKGRRSFNKDSISSYKFLTEDVASAFECIFTFNSNDRSVSAYKLENFGKTVPVVLSFKNLIKELNISWREDDIKTMLYVTGGNDATGTPLSIAGVNGSGNGYITNFSYFYDQMSMELKTKLEEYYQLMDTNRTLITTALSQLNALYDELYDLNNKLPTDESSTDWTQYGLKGLKAKEKIYLSNMSLYTDKMGNDPTSAQAYTDNNTLWSQVTAEIIVRELQITDKTAEIATKQAEVQSYTVDIKAVLGDELYVELQPFIREDNLCDDSYIATDIMTDSEVLAMKQDLYEHGVNELSRVCFPQFEMTLDSVNFPVLFKYKEWTEQLELGDIVRIKFSDTEYFTARLLKMELDWDNFKNFSLTFSSKTSLEDGFFEFETIKNMVNRSSTTLDYKTSGWNEASKQATTAYNATKKEILDLSLQQIQSNANNIVTDLNDAGLLFRKYLPDENKFAPEKLWITNRQILLFEEPDGTNLKTPKVAIGKVYKTVNGVTKVFYAVAADVIAGDMYFGESLAIQNSNNTLTLDQNGFVASATNGFRVQINPDDPANILNISKNGSKLFYIDAVTGKLVFKGRAEIDEGYIANWTIAQNKLYSGGVGMSSDATTGAVAFWAGNATPTSAPFRVTNSGELTAVNGKFINGDFTGRLISNEGTIGGWNIGDNGLTGSSPNSYIIGGKLAIASGIFVADYGGVKMGDYYVSADGTGTLRSVNGYVNITDELAGGVPITDYAQLTIGNSEFSTMVTISGKGYIKVPYVECQNIYFPDDEWTGGMGSLDMLKQVYDRLNQLKNFVGMGSWNY